MVTAKSLRIFFVSLFLVFLMVVLPHLASKVRPWSLRLQDPYPAKLQDVLEKVKPQLNFPANNFQLKKPFVPIVSAGSDYEAASAYGVIDFDNGKVLASKNLSEKLPMASLTKVMTAVVALDLAGPEERFTVSQKAASIPPTKMMLKSGESYSLKDLLAFALISSANDGSQVIKEGINQKYGQDIFIEAMNQKAKFLGLKNTHFNNPQGFDSKDQFSSIEDLTILSHYAMGNYPLIALLVKQSYKDLTENWDQRFYLNNWNGLLGVYPGVLGIKIGNTEKAGNCTIVLAEREGKKVLVTLLGAPGVLERDHWTAELLDLGFGKLAGLSPVNITEDQLREKYASWKYFE